MPQMAPLSWTLIFIACLFSTLSIFKTLYFSKKETEMSQSSSPPQPGTKNMKSWK